jgi:nuclear pore complex protein Nup98-Nup96
LFGKPAAVTTGATGGLFGQSTQPAAAPTTGGLFGQPTQPSTGLFGATTTPTNTLFGQKPLLSNTSSFGTSVGAGQQPVLHASLDKNPYGVNPLLSKSTNEPPAPIQQPTPQKKLPTVVPSFKVTPRSSSQIKLRGVAPPSQSPALAESYRSQIKILDGSPRDVVALGLDTRFTPRRSVKRLTIDDASTLLQTPKEKTVQFDVPEPPSTMKIPIATPTKKDYVLSPSLDTLLRMSDEELKKVEKFTISIPVFGSVQFIDPVDLHEIGRNNIQSLPGKTVLIESQLVTVYPDDDDKPPAGQGLNKPAIISLVGCWPKDKSTGAIIDNENDPRFDKHLKKLKRMEDTTFIGFEVVTGTWKFRVEHFSRYGLIDSDEEEEGLDENEKDSDDKDDDESNDVNDTFMKGGKWELVATSDASDITEEEDLETDSGDEIPEDDSASSSEHESQSAAEEDVVMASALTNQAVEGLGIGAKYSPIEYMAKAKNVQTMKATLFGSRSPKSPNKPFVTPSFQMEEVEKRVPERSPDSKSVRALFSAFPKEVLPHASKYLKENESKVIAVPTDLTSLTDYSKSISGNKTKLFVDAAYFQGRSFRSSFSHQGLLIQNQ